MKDANCVVEVGIHPTPYWKDKNSDLVMCNRHRAQYDQKDDVTPVEWEPYNPMIEHRNIFDKKQTEDK